MSATIVVAGNQTDAEGRHIHDRPSASSAHHARFQLPGGNCSPVYGPDSFARLRGGVAVGERTGHLASPDFCGVRLRWSSPSRVNSVQEPARGFMQRFKRLLWWLAHDEQPTNRSLSWVTRNKSRVA